MKKLNDLKLVIIAVIIPAVSTHLFLSFCLQKKLIETHKGTTDGALIVVAGYVVTAAVAVALIWGALILLKFFKKI